MSNVVVYYSWSGNCKVASELISERINGSILELLEAKKTSRGFFGFMKGGFQAVFRKKVELKGNPFEEVSQYEKIYLVSPIWASNLVPAMRTFIEKTDFKDKDVVVITIQADPKKSGSNKVLEEFKKIIEDRGGEVESMHALHGGTPFSKEKRTNKEGLKTQISEINWD